MSPRPSAVHCPAIFLCHSSLCERSASITCLSTIFLPLTIMSIITLTKQVQDIEAAAPLGVGAPDDVLMVNRSALVEAIAQEILDYFSGSSEGEPRLQRSEAFWIATGAMNRAIQADSTATRSP